MKLEPIDTSTTAGKARVMQLAAEGRKVVVGAGSIPPWKVMDKDPSWDWSTFTYAIEAQPVGSDEVWAIVFPTHLGLFEDKNDAMHHAAIRELPVVRYRRVEE